MCTHTYCAHHPIELGHPPIQLDPALMDCLNAIAVVRSSYCFAYIAKDVLLAHTHASSPVTVFTETVTAIRMMKNVGKERLVLFFEKQFV